MSIETTKGAVPRLRFPEFEGEWVEKSLGSVSDVRDGTHDSPKFYSTGKPLVTSKNLLSNGSLDLVNTSLISEEDFEQINKRSRVDIGDILFGMIGTIGNPVMVRSEGFAIKNVALIKPQGELLNEYLVHFLSSQYVSTKLDKLNTGNTQKFIALGVLRSLEVLVPSIDEQQKIAATLSSLDDLIAAEVEKGETLKAHKRGLMQVLFPAEGEGVPRVRFEGFEGDWIFTELGKVGDIQMCKRIFAEETNARGGVPFYKIGTLGGTPDAFISRELFEEYKNKYNYPRKGEVLITCSGTVGKCVVYDGEDAYYQDSNIVWIDNPAFKIRNELLFYLLSTANWNQLSSTTITRIYGSDLRNLKITFPPSHAEQQKIAQMLASVDELITSQSNKLRQLAIHKIGLMQQLFPKISVDTPATSQV